jgi:hypothetical protein
LKVEFRSSFLKDVKALRDRPLKERIKAALVASLDFARDRLDP